MFAEDAAPTVTFGPVKSKQQAKDWVEVTEQIRLVEKVVTISKEEQLLKTKLHEKKVKEQRALIEEAKLQRYKKLLAAKELKSDDFDDKEQRQQHAKKEQNYKDRTKSVRYGKLTAGKKAQNKPVLDPLGFNSKTRRFSTIGTHPAFQKLGCLRDYKNIGPATYDPDERIHIGAINWKNSQRTKIFSKTLGYQVPRLLEERQWDAGNIGPALYNVPDPRNLEELCQCSPVSNVGFSRAKRFKRKKACATPGPGTYGVPHALLEANTPVRRVWTHVPPFEWSGNLDRCADSKRKYHLPPNIYTVKDPDSITEKVKHSVSKRGPYDVFTGPRDETTIKGYLAPSKFKGSKSWPNDIPNNPRYADNPNSGKWSEGSRFETIPGSRIMVTSITLCRKDPDSPGPADYNPHSPSLLKPVAPGKRYPFNNSKVHARPLPPWKLQPGVGRYTFLDPSKLCPCANTYQSVFKSKDKRGEWIYPETLNSF